MIDAILQTSKTPAAALHDLDANKPGGSIKIRVKTYAHSLLLQHERLEDQASKKRSLAETVDRKRLELLQLKQQQLAGVNQTDEALAKAIAETSARIMSYETRRAAEVELPKGTVRLGKKAADGSIVPIEQPQAQPAADAVTAAE
jgi:hypothetical protein